MKHSEVIDSLENDDEIQAYLRSQNVNAVERLNYNDHGPEHVRIVRDNALKLVDILEDKVGFGVEDHGPGFGVEDAKVVVAVASELHDIGHVVHRDDHVKYSVGLADRLVDRVLEGFYGTRARVALKGDVLHAILCHHVDENPLTAEAGIVRLADALDMEEGRSRLPYKKGERSIDTVSS
ncbi:MAG: HD domain-containing protein, partial [Halobacteria archaeon]|nr:HD domain-containing protein [Halobacteria archaeon]